MIEEALAEWFDPNSFELVETETFPSKFFLLILGDQPGVEDWVGRGVFKVAHRWDVYVCGEGLGLEHRY
jgi:hypothetical protein